MVKGCPLLHLNPSEKTHQENPEAPQADSPQNAFKDAMEGAHSSLLSWEEQVVEEEQQQQAAPEGDRSRVRTLTLTAWP